MLSKLEMAFHVLSGRRGSILPASSIADDLKATDVHILTTGRLVLRATMGLRLLQADIVASECWVAPPSCHTTDDGRLVLSGSSGPMVLKRFRLLKAIGSGSFSDVFAGEDVLLGRRVAVKVMKKECETLGYREKIILDTIATRNPRGPCYCKLTPSLHVCALLTLP